MTGPSMFHPWVGDRYGQPDNVLAGCRLMIVGESHYTENHLEVGSSPPGMTTEVVKWFAIAKRHQFFGKLQEIVTGKPRRSHTEDDKRAFWSSVVFYNYVPVLVDGRPVSEGGARRRPTREMFEAGAEPFRQVRDRHEPSAIMVCGLETWDYMAPHLPGFAGPARDVIYYDDGSSIYARIQHPSWPQFDPEKWYPRIHRLIEMSAEDRRQGDRTMWDASRN